LRKGKKKKGLDVLVLLKGGERKGSWAMEGGENGDRREQRNGGKRKPISCIRKREKRLRLSAKEINERKSNSPG